MFYDFYPTTATKVSEVIHINTPIFFIGDVYVSIYTKYSPFFKT